MTTSAFDQFYRQLNPAQKTAVDQTEGAVMVIAGPGTGKTQVLTLRIANILLKHQVNPENILALTFTEAGVTAMRERLISIIGPTAYQVHIHTFHGFAHMIIRQYPEEFDQLINAHLISEIEQISLLEEIITQATLPDIKPTGDPLAYVRPALIAITQLKRERQSPDDLQSAIDQQKSDFETNEDVYHQTGRYKGRMKGKYQQLEKQIVRNSALVQVYRRYQQELNHNHQFDYEDMLLSLIHVLDANPDFLLRLQEQFQFILIDEHQDTNQTQNDIIYRLADFHPNPNLCIVGDEKQAIYRFQGASLSNFLMLKHKYPDAILISLTYNYRSPQQILDAATQLIDHNTLPADLNLPLREPLEAQSHPPKPGIEICQLDDEISQYFYLAYRINQLKNNNINLDEVAILARTNADIDAIVPALKQHNIPFVIYTKKNILSHPHIQAFIRLLACLDNLDDDQTLLMTMQYHVTGIHPRDVIYLRALASTQNKTVWQTLDDLNTQAESQGLQNPTAIKSYYQNLIKWHALSQESTPDLVFTTVLHESGLLQRFLHHADETTISLVTSLYQHLQNIRSQQQQYTLTEFLNHLDRLQNHNLSPEAPLTTPKSNAVQLRTAHGAKGLEFSHVFLINTIDKKWGNSNRGGPQFVLPYEYLDTNLKELLESEKNADERRLFYVAATRAKSNLTIMYPKFKTDGTSVLPSQFIAEFQTDQVIHADTSQFAQDFEPIRDQSILAPPPISSVDQDAIKQTIKQHFKTYGLSVSALNNYLTCPWKYYFRNIVRIPESKTPSLVFGSAIHQVVHRFLSTNKSISADTLIQFFDEYLQSQPISPIEATELNQKAQQVITSFYPILSQYPSQAKSEVTISTSLTPDIKLTGKLDALIPQPHTHQFDVVDFKTGKPKSRNHILGSTKNSNGDIFRQLVFYKLLLTIDKPARYPFHAGIIVFVEPTSAGQHKEETFLIEQSAVEQLTHTISDMYQALTTLSFWDKRCEDQQCRYCQLRQQMEP